jgi:hypothetical protein
MSLLATNVSRNLLSPHGVEGDLGGIAAEKAG